MTYKRLLKENEIIVSVEVKTEKSYKFLNEIYKNKLGDELNVSELLSLYNPLNTLGFGILIYDIACIPENKEKIENLGFRSFLNNPEFNLDCL